MYNVHFTFTKKNAHTYFEKQQTFVLVVDFWTIEHWTYWRTHTNTHTQSYVMHGELRLKPLPTTNRGPRSCNNLAAERMSETVSSFRPSKADASFRFGVTMSAIGRSPSLQAEQRYHKWKDEMGHFAPLKWKFQCISADWPRNRKEETLKKVLRYIHAGGIKTYVRKRT